MNFFKSACIVSGFFIATAIMNTPAIAQSCGEALIVTTYRDNSESSRDYRLSEYVSENHWNKLKEKYSADAIVYDVPVGSEYEKYKSASQAKIKKTSSRLTEHQARNILWTGLEGASLQAYESCLQASQYGLFLYVRSATKNEVEVVVKYSSTVANTQAALTWTGGTTEIRQALPQTISSGESIPTILPRPNDEFLLAAKVTGLNAPPAIRVTAYPPPPLPLPEAPCVASNAGGQCTRCSGSLAANGVASNGRVPFACPRTVPSGQYFARVTGEIHPTGDPAIVGHVAIYLEGPGQKRTTLRKIDTASSSTATAFNFTTEDSGPLSENSARGAFVVEDCKDGVGPKPCTIKEGAKWEICMAGTTC